VVDEERGSREETVKESQAKAELWSTVVNALSLFLV